MNHLGYLIVVVLLFVSVLMNEVQCAKLKVKLKNCEVSDINADVIKGYNCTVNNDGDNSKVSISAEFNKELGEGLILRHAIYSKHGDTWKKFNTLAMFDKDIDPCKIKEDKMRMALVKSVVSDFEPLKDILHGCPYSSLKLENYEIKSYEVPFPVPYGEYRVDVTFFLNDVVLSKSKMYMTVGKA